MGLERFLAWILERYTVRECVPFRDTQGNGKSFSRQRLARMLATDSNRRFLSAP
jgi:hypothetical protein